MESSTTRPGWLAAHEAGRVRAAARHATRAYPGPVGELLAGELRLHAEFGYRFDRSRGDGAQAHGGRPGCSRTQPGT